VTCEIRFRGDEEGFLDLRRRLRRWLEALGCHGRETEEMVLAVQEAAANVVRHAYRGDESGELVLRILRDEGRLLFRLIDFAPGTGVRELPRFCAGEGQCGGRGVYLMRCIMDRVEFRTPAAGEGNVLEMSKRVTGIQGASD